MKSFQKGFQIQYLISLTDDLIEEFKDSKISWYLGHAKL